MSSPLPAVRAAASKQLLLGLLAHDEHERLGLSTEPAALAETERWVRARYGLMRRADVTAFLDASGLSPDQFMAHVGNLHEIATVQRHHDAEVEALLPRYRGMFGIRDFLLRREEERP